MAYGKSFDTEGTPLSRKLSDTEALDQGHSLTTVPSDAELQNAPSRTHNEVPGAQEAFRRETSNNDHLDYQHSHNLSKSTPSSQRRTSHKFSSNYSITKVSLDNHCRTSSSTKAPTFSTAKLLHPKKQFPCTFSPYGCPAIFASKNEWKRHVYSQHLQLGFYRCDAGFCNPGNDPGKGRRYNDFNRKDLFTQHHRRMHLPFSGKYENASEKQRDEFDEHMAAVRERCWVTRREVPQQSSCGICGRNFNGEHAWDECMEHVGQHIERNEASDVREDQYLTQWAINEGLIRDCGNRGKWLAGLEPEDLEGNGNRPSRGDRRTVVLRNGGDAEEKDEHRHNAQSTTAFADSALGSSINAAGYTQSRIESELDMRSVTTDTQDMMISQELRDDLVSEFADILYRDLCDSMVSGPNFIAREADVITQLLPDALKDFTHQLEPAVGSETQRKAILLVRGYRREIALHFSDHIDVLPSVLDEGIQQDGQLSGSQQMSIEEKFSSWNTEGAGPVKEQNNADDRQFPNEHEISAARSFLIEGMPFQWLLGLLRVAATTTMWKHSALRSISDTVRIHLASLAPQGKQATTQRAVFEVIWDPLTFIEEQAYSGCEETIVDKIITINGSIHEAQALTCAQYMQQTWPTTGADALGAIVSAIARGRCTKYQSRLPCGVELSITVNNSHLVVRASGGGSLLAEVASQLSWLCAACRAGPRGNRFAQSTPQIKVPDATEPRFKISALVRVTENYEANASHNGTCWHALFNNPVLVTDVPIATREHGEEGLEAPLNMIAALGEASQATVFDELVLIKGHSTMFVPTKYVKDSICWHFLYNADGSRMPYWAATSRMHNYVKTDTLTIHDLAGARHFVGWTPSASSKAGTKNAIYTNIDYSQLDTVGKGIAFERATLSLGMYFSGAVSFVLGEKDKATYLSSATDIYEVQISSARNSYVTMYDAADHRAWLLDGASALLHITRTQIESPPYNQDSKTFLDSFCYPQSDHGADAALRALQNETNRALPIFTKSKKKRIVVSDGSTAREEVKITMKEWCFQDLVQQTWYNLERLIDRQGHIAALSTVELRCDTQEELLGIEFMDLVRGKALLMPRVAILRPSGRGWLDLTKRIGAPCLVGRGFGDLIVPGRTSETNSSTLCRHWTRMPKGKDYLASLTATLREICREYGSKDSEPLKLAHDIYWYQLRNPFGNCANKCQRGRQSCDPLQVLSPTLHGASKKRPDGFSEDYGAIIFGKSRRLRIDWAHIKFPWTGRDADTDSEGDLDLQDSGLESSLMTSTSGSSTGEDGRHGAFPGKKPPTICVPQSQYSPTIDAFDERMTAGDTSDPNPTILKRTCDNAYRANIPTVVGSRRELFPDSKGRRGVLSNTDSAAGVSLQAALDAHSEPLPSSARSSTRRRRLEDGNISFKRLRFDRM